MTTENLLPDSLNSPFQNELWWHEVKVQYYLIPKGTHLVAGKERIKTLEGRSLCVEPNSLIPFKCSLIRAFFFNFAFSLWSFYFAFQVLFRIATKSESITYSSADFLTRTIPGPTAGDDVSARTPDAFTLEHNDLNRLHNMAQSILSKHEPQTQEDVD